MRDATYPSLYQINTRIWLTELARMLRRASLSRKDAVGVRVEATPRRLKVAATPSSPDRRSQPNSASKRCDGGVALTFGDAASPLLARAASASFRLR